MKLLLLFSLFVVLLSALPSDVDDCKVCKVAVSLSQTGNRKLIEKAFIAECRKTFPFALGSLACKKFVDLYLDQFILKIEAGIPPEKVCADIKVCDIIALPTPSPSD